MNKKIKADLHLHSDFSGDSTAPMEDMIQQGIRNGLEFMCMTEHMDLDYPLEDGIDFTLDTDRYFTGYQQLKRQYTSKIELGFGVELGLQPHLADFHRAYSKAYPFDFIIGSSHVVHGKDPYYPSFYQDRTEDEAYMDYFLSIFENLRTAPDIDVYGHIDYVVRYGPNKNKYYSYRKFSDILDQILITLIDQGIGIECNTGGIKYGLGHPNPCEEVLSRYRELGGEIITIGSDAHTPQHICYAFDSIPALLESCGFSYYTVFKNRKPEFIHL